MSRPPFYPYRSEAARDTCYGYFDALATRKWPAPSEDRLVPTSWGSTFVRVNGPAAAPPLVLLHGATATSLMWIPNIPTISTARRTYAVDQIGDFGKSVCARPPRSIEDFTAWLDELFDALEFRAGVDLAGMSYGGALAVQYALRYPARVRKLVLLGPASSVYRTPLVFWAHIVRMLLNRRKGVVSFLRWVFPDMARRDPQFIDDTAGEILLNMSSLVPRKSTIPPVVSDAEWGRLAVPTLFLVGEHEVIYPAEKAVRRLRRVAPSVTPEIVPGAGHDLTLVQPGLVNRRILEFLAGRPATLQPRALARSAPFVP